jgi:cytochrome c2
LGDPDLGLRLALRYGCAGCHTIPGIPGAQGKVGPTLQGFAARVYIGGVAANSPDTLIQWIENPKSIDPETAMPVTGISREEARHVAAYLYTLR